MSKIPKIHACSESKSNKSQFRFRTLYCKVRKIGYYRTYATSEPDRVIGRPEVGTRPVEGLCMPCAENDRLLALESPRLPAKSCWYVET